MIERIFWKHQDIMRDYKINKFKINSTTLMTTILPVGFLYGSFYEKFIRKIPFSLQTDFVIVTYMGVMKVNLEIRYFKRRLKDYEEKITKEKIDK